MSDWATYRLSDLLLFAPRTYYRLFELYNAEVWPWHLAALGVGLAILAMAIRGGRRAATAVCALLAGCWLWVAWAFHFQRYAAINWAAIGFAAAFAAQAVLLLGAVAVRPPMREPSGAANAGLGLLAFALFVHPCVGALLGRPWLQTELFGLAPDPTAVATLGVLLLLRPAGPPGGPAASVAQWLLWPIPLLWCAVSGATLWAMDAADALLLPAAALLAIAAEWRARRRPASRRRV